MKRMMFSAGCSGAGKTSISLGIIGALIRRGMHVASAKIGPDYIDPMYHRALGAYGINLDRYLMEDAYILHLMARLESYDVIVMEGAMGYYDGISTTSVASAAEMANFTKTPTIFIASGRGRGASLGAELQGFLNYKENTMIGVLLNQTKPVMASYYEKIIKETTGLPLFGCIPDVTMDLPERYLGLYRPGELDAFRAFSNSWIELVERYVDLDAMLAACEAKAVGREIREKRAKKKIAVAIAMDEAFCFYYQDVLDDLESAGVEWIFFSPLRDPLPKPISGVYFGGGYPELYKEMLGKNETLARDLKSFVAHDGVLLAEGGGFMSVLQSIDGMKALELFPGTATMTDRLQRFGYQMVSAEKDGLLLKAGQRAPSHEFHYSAATVEGSDLYIEKANGTKKRRTAYCGKHIYAGYPEFHLSGNSLIRENFLRALREATPWQG